MALRETPTLKRRTIGIVLALVGCSSLVLLPIIGIARIDRTTHQSHDYSDLVAATEQLSNGLLQMVTGSLAKYGANHEPEERSSSAAALELAKAQLTLLESKSAVARDLGLEEPLTAHLAKAKVVVTSSESYLSEIDAGHSVSDAQSTASVVTAAGDLLKSQGQFTLAAGPESVQLDSDRRDALQEAKLLLIAAVVLAVITLGTLLVLDDRKVHRVFAHERARRELAERLAAHRADVVNVASHELRNPLTVLTLATDTIERAAAQRTDEEMVELARDAHAAALRCESMVVELLDLSRLDADRLDLKVGATPLEPALHDAILMSESHHGPRVLVVSGDEGATVTADPNRLRIILRNLLDNAFKYSPAGSTVYVNVEEYEHRIRVDVRDEGVGIPEASRERVFQRFERLSATQDVPGVGIGLYLSRELARRMDGDLKCGESDRGASFLLELPLPA